MPAVHTPEGKTIHFPDTFTPEQIKEAMANLPQNKRFNEQITDNLYAGRDRSERPNTLERIGRGAMDTVDRLAQLNFAMGEAVGLYPEGLGEAGTRAQNQEQAEYEKNRRSGDVDVARFLGSAGMTSPLALVPGGQTFMGSVGSGLGTGAVAGGLQYDPEYSLANTARNTAVGAGLGSVAGPVMRGAAIGLQSFMENGMGRFVGLMERTKGNAKADEIIREIPELGELPVEMRANLIIEAQEQIKRTGTLNAEQLARKANLVANDVTPTKSMVTRDPRDWTMERNMQKLSQSPDEQISAMGQELTGVYNANDQALSGRLKSFSAGLPKGTQESHGMTVLKGLDDLERLSQKDVSNLYDMVRTQHGDKLASDAGGLVKTLDDLKDNTYAEKLVSSVQNKLKRFGMLDKDGNITTNTLTVTQAEELRKFVNTLPNDFGKRDIIKAIDGDVLSGAGDDFFAKARSAAMARKQMLDNPATQRALNAYGELTQGKTAQNFIKSQVVDAAEQDVASLLATLSKLPKQQADEAATAMKAGVLDFLQEKSINPNSGQFSGAKLNDAMRAVGDGKLEKILGAQGYKELKSLARASLDATYQPPYAAVNHSGTAPMLLSMTQKARAIPGVPLVVNENVEKLAARSGYSNQLADVMAAKAASSPPVLDPRVRSLIRMIQQSGAPAGAAVANQYLDSKRQ
jgi:hypothetical protein